MLVQGLRQLVGEETKGDAPLTMEILSHPLIHPIRQMKGPGRYRIPSYIPADLFAKALMDIVHAPATEVAAGGSHVSPRLLHALKTLQTGATETVAPDQSGVEQWYEQHMERVSGWYKRYTQTVILIIAVALTLFLNADTIHLSSRLWSDSALRSAVLESAKVRLQEGPPLQAVEYADPLTPKPSKPASDGAANHVLPDEQALLERMLGWSEDWGGLQKVRCGMQRRFMLTIVLAILSSSVAGHAADPKFEVQLKKAWVTKVQDLTSVEADMVVHHSHQKPNKVGTGSEDGDLHFSGESDDVGLPFVAEVVNAASENNAVSFIKSTAAANEDNPSHPSSIRVIGAWRLWFEHPSRSQIQGADNAFSPDTTNPNHSFEIHPVAAVNTGQKTFDVHDSFVPVQDAKTHKLFKAYPAETAFPYFEGLKTTVKASSSGKAIRSGQLKYNYVDFNIELTQKPKQVDDGFIALANVVGGEDEDPLPGGLRMIFVGGSAGAKAMSTAKSGDSFHVLGIPRVNLNAISFLVSQHGTTQFTAKLPYEMIIVGIYAN